MLGPISLNFNVNPGILFIVGGIAQVFWIIPMIRRWGIPWYAIGIAGTVVFMALWIISIMPDNPITGRAGPADNPIAITIEVFQAAFIGLAAAIIIYEYKKKKKGQQEVEKSVTRARRQKTYAHSGWNSYRFDIDWIVCTTSYDAKSNGRWWRRSSKTRRSRRKCTST